MNLYSRHIQLFEPDDFTKINNTKILVAGAGGLGSTVLQLLTRYGFGEIHIFEDAIVDLPDLNRQVLYNTYDLGKTKTSCAYEILRKINPDIEIHTHTELIGQNTKPPTVDIVIDCVDNYQGRIDIDNLFFKNGIPVIHAGAESFFGQITTLIPGKTKSYCDTFNITSNHKTLDIPKDIFPPVVTLLASLQVSEAIKLCLGKYENLYINKIFTVDLYHNAFDIIKLS